jgi:hypothetical protein
MNYSKLLQLIVESAGTVDPHSVEEIEKMMKNKGEIDTKPLDKGIVALNFNRNVFQKGIWNKQTITARGLFYDTNTKNIIARGFEKFFNIGEKVAEEKQTIEKIESKLAYPVRAWVKANGFLGILGIVKTDISNIMYTGIFFESEQITSNFYKEMPNQGYKVKDPHITLSHYKNISKELKEEKINSFIEFSNKNDIECKVIAQYISKDKELSALKVEITTPGLKSDNIHAHITLWVGPNRKAVESNDLISNPSNEDTVIPINNITINGGHVFNCLNKKNDENNKQIVEPIFNEYNFFIASKSTNKGEFSLLFKNIFSKLFNNQATNIKKLLQDMVKYNFSLVFEVISKTEDPHIIEYAEDSIVLLDAIRNKIKFETLPYSYLKKIGKNLQLPVKELAKNIKNGKEFKNFLKEISNPNYKYGKDQIEGFVFQDTKNYMFKFKGNFYNYWKKLRSPTESIVKSIAKESIKNLNDFLEKDQNGKLKVREDKRKALMDKLGIKFNKYQEPGQKQFLEFIINKYINEPTIDEKKINIIELRKSFLQENPNFKITKNIYDINDNDGEGDEQDNNKEEKNKIGTDLQLDKLTLEELKKIRTEAIENNLPKDRMDKLNTLYETLRKSIKDTFNTFFIQYGEENKKAIEAINKVEKPTIIISCGIPGSGKSTFLNKIASKYTTHSTDDILTDKESGLYNWSKESLQKAHNQNLINAMETMKQNENIIIDNTNLDVASFKDYLKNLPKNYKVIFLIFIRKPSDIMSDNGIYSLERLKINKSFIGQERKILDKIEKFYFGLPTEKNPNKRDQSGIQQILARTKDFK